MGALTRLFKTYLVSGKLNQWDTSLFISHHLYLGQTEHLVGRTIQDSKILRNKYRRGIFNGQTRCFFSLLHSVSKILANRARFLAYVLWFLPVVVQLFSQIVKLLTSAHTLQTRWVNLSGCYTVGAKE